jgi:hypothetical protein
MRHPERLDPHRLIHGAHHVVKRYRAWRGQPLWTLVAEMTSHGSTYSMEICEDLGFNPHHKIGEPLERRPEAPVRPTLETPAVPCIWRAGCDKKANCQEAGCCLGVRSNRGEPG